RKGEVRVRGRLQPDEVDRRRRRARLVELDEPKAPGLQGSEKDGGSEVAALGERDRLSRAGEGEDGAGGGRRAGCEKQYTASLELSEGLFGLCACRVVVSRVVEAPRLAVPVRLVRRAVDAHLTRAPAATPRFETTNGIA